MPPIRGSAPKLCRSSGSNAHPYDHSSPFSTPKKVRQSNTPGNYQSARIQSSPSTPGRLLGNLLESPLRLPHGRQAAKTHDEQQSVDGVTEAHNLEHESEDISLFHFSPIRLSTPLLDLECEKPSLRMPLNMTLDATFDAFRTPSTARDRGLVLAPLDETQFDHVSPPGERDIGARIDPLTDDSESNPLYSPPYSPLPLSSILNDAALTLLLDDEQTSDTQAEQEGNTLSTNRLDWMHANDIRSTATLEELRLLDVYQLVKDMLVSTPPPASPTIEHDRLEDINAAVRDGGIHDGLDYDAGSSSRATDTTAHAIAQALLSDVQELLLRKTTEGDYEATVCPADLQR